MSAKRFAWFGMYDHPGQHAANDALWSAVAARLRSAGLSDVPETLDRSLSPDDAWASGSLLLGQICIRPLRDRFPALTVVANPVYAGTAIAGCHRAHVVVSAGSNIESLDGLKNIRFAMNDSGSNTGHALLVRKLGPVERWTKEVVTTGSHRASLIAIAEGRADAASIDEITLAAIERHEPDLAARIRVIGQSGDAPAPPFVTAADAALAPLLGESLRAALVDPSAASIREMLGLIDVRPMEAAVRYDRSLSREAAASSRSSAAFAR